MIQSPRVLPERAAPPGRILSTVTVEQLCRLADIPMRVSGETGPKIVCIDSPGHFFGPDGVYYVGVKAAPRTRVGALRVLEVLAHSFHDYVSRECVCGRGLFVAPTGQRGRPRVGAMAMSARERMAAMRVRRSAELTPSRSIDG
jgi:hypothetical protein